LKYRGHPVDTERNQEVTRGRRHGQGWHRARSPSKGKSGTSRRRAQEGEGSGGRAEEKGGRQEEQRRRAEDGGRHEEGRLGQTTIVKGCRKGQGFSHEKGGSRAKGSGGQTGGVIEEGHRESRYTGQERREDRSSEKGRAPPPRHPHSRAPATTRKAPPRKLSGTATAQVFTVSHLNEADFKSDGLRAYAQYRDLGIAAATAGLCQAHVIRLIPPCTDEVRKRHLHEAELQLVYVLKGWIKNEFEGRGEQMMSAGSCWLQPSGIEHTVLDYSADCELLEVIVPADFSTEDVV
jgi:uncharacterized RmlC-like cupin family protein